MDDFTNIYKIDNNGTIYYCMVSQNNITIYDINANEIDLKKLEVEGINTEPELIEPGDVPKNIREKHTGITDEERIEKERLVKSLGKRLGITESKNLDMNIKKYEDFINEEIQEGPEITNQKFVTSPRPNIAPAPQGRIDLGVTEQDLIGGINKMEYDEILLFIKDLMRKFNEGVITDEEKILSEVLYSIVKNPYNRNLDYDMFYHRRLGFVKANKDKKI